ncbi:GNAT family N-acetyltransferase [Neorhizobium sp. JUb45]|uniref:GNAT family N-acetyltransferase n=1 Tax=Neorhizobium sp. JUb45 TaxID=2485113 RepID=UPI0010DE503B|nr:GNAT family N-acetyltransferase [Neorhizobium sp. JUb45]TCQ99183.1 acetyltransferase (GNAT) family protein [Neorhizobium sp. JUb45]
MGVEMAIRDATPGDREAITSLHVRVSQRAYAGMLPADYLADIMPDEKARLWEERLSGGVDPERLRVTLAHIDTELAGFSCFLFDQETQFGTYLHNLYVDPDYQGKGIARSLLSASVQRLSAQQRNQPVHLLTLADNHPARRFYEKLNGQIIEEKRNVMASNPELLFVRYQWRSADDLHDNNFNLERKNLNFWRCKSRS